MFKPTTSIVPLLMLALFVSPLGATCVDTCPCHFCCPVIEQVTESKTEWKVECEKACIPAIRLPWEPGGSKLTLLSWWNVGDKASRCGCESGLPCKGAAGGCTPCAEGIPTRSGKVRVVNVLSKESREVTVCRCKWEIRHRRESGPAATLGCACGTVVDQPAEPTVERLPLVPE